MNPNDEHDDLDRDEKAFTAVKVYTSCIVLLYLKWWLSQHMVQSLIGGLPVSEEYL